MTVGMYILNCKVLSTVSSVLCTSAASYFQAVGIISGTPTNDTSSHLEEMCRQAKPSNRKSSWVDGGLIS